MTERDDHAETVPVCTTCGRVLNLHVDDDGAQFRHVPGDADDHPVTYAEVSLNGGAYRGRCDFCHQDGTVFWTLRTRPFAYLGVDDDGRWAACVSCAPLLATNQWGALLRRAQASWLARHPDKPGWANGLDRLYRVLRTNMISLDPPQG